MTSKSPGVINVGFPPARADFVNVPPAVSFAQPEELLIVVNPVDFVLLIDPGVVVIRQDGGDLAVVDIRQHDADRVLVPVELLENDLVGVARPFHEGDVVVARVAGNVQPARFSARGRDDADAAGGIGFADLGILDRVDAGIKRVGVIDQGKLANARRVRAASRRSWFRPGSSGSRRGARTLLRRPSRTCR